MAIISDNADGLPVSIYVTSAASPHEVTFAEATISKKCFVSDEKPERLVGDKAYDRDPLDEKLYVEYGVEMISPHRRWRKRPKTQDGRPLRRYKHRWWKIERLFFAWLQNFRHILVRHDYYSENFLGFVLLGCIMILLRRCL